MADAPKTQVPWNNQEPDNQNLQALAIHLAQMLDKIKELEKKVTP